MKGTLIVIDGTDGSGKATQTKKLKERLMLEGYTVHTLDFPQYDNNFFGNLIGEGLRGDLGDWVSLHPKIASIIYACDRLESSQQIQTWLNNGDIVLLDRYVSSNQIHQGGKILDEKERKEFLSWLDTMEHEVLSTPRPDLILYLNVPIAVTQTLIHSKENQVEKTYLNGRRDQHETDTNHLTQARASALKLVAERNNYTEILCTENNNILPIETIHNLVYAEVETFLS